MKPGKFKKKGEIGFFYPQVLDYVDKTYGALGRLASVSNPHRSTGSSTDGNTTELPSSSAHGIIRHQDLLNL